MRISLLKGVFFSALIGITAPAFAQDGCVNNGLKFATNVVWCVTSAGPPPFSCTVSISDGVAKLSCDDKGDTWAGNTNNFLKAVNGNDMNLARQTYSNCQRHSSEAAGLLPACGADIRVRNAVVHALTCYKPGVPNSFVGYDNPAVMPLGPAATKCMRP